MTDQTLIECSVCGGPIQPVGTWLLGNNAEPVNDGRCCDHCNATVVIPTRLRRMMAGRNPREIVATRLSPTGDE